MHAGAGVESTGTSEQVGHETTQPLASGLDGVAMLPAGHAMQSTSGHGTSQVGQNTQPLASGIGGIAMLPSGHIRQRTCGHGIAGTQSYLCIELEWR